MDINDTTQEVRVRYNRNKKHLRNTLTTVQVDDKVFFGIARCNVGAEKFTKAVGRELATTRTLLAAFEDTKDYEQLGNVAVHKNRLRGFVNVANIPDLLNYFRKISRHVYKGGKKSK